MRPHIIWMTLAIALLASYRCVAQQASAPVLLPPPSAAELERGDADSMQLPMPKPSATASGDEVLPVPATEAQSLISIEPNVVRVETPPAWHRRDHWIGPEPWETGIELGINGSSGTSESLSIRAGGNVKRESRFSRLNLKTSYNRTTESGDATQNNAQFDVRNDWLLDDASPWTLYGTGDVFYDEFQAFDVQTSANSGVGYRFVHDPELDLIGRFGGGASREFGGPDDRWVPESLLGFEYNQKLSNRQKYYAKVDYYPEWEQFGEFRLIADTGWQIQFAEPSNLSLKISASDRYDSTPNDAEPHLVNYSVLLLLNL